MKLDPKLTAEVVEFLRQPNPAVMGTVRADGMPVTVATWYLWDEGRILLNLDAERWRMAHLRRDPRVSLTVIEAKDWYRHVSVQGHVTIEDDPDLVDIDRLSMHYRGRPYFNRTRPRVTAWMEIEHVHLWPASGWSGQNVRSAGPGTATTRPAGDATSKGEDKR
jgi:PPOX class probable F420-dependent enzyme